MTNGDVHIALNFSERYVFCNTQQSFEPSSDNAVINFYRLMLKLGRQQIRAPALTCWPSVMYGKVSLLPCWRISQSGMKSNSHFACFTVSCNCLFLLQLLLIFSCLLFHTHKLVICCYFKMLFSMLPCYCSVLFYPNWKNNTLKGEGKQHVKSMKNRLSCESSLFQNTGFLKCFYEQ